MEIAAAKQPTHKAMDSEFVSRPTTKMVNLDHMKEFQECMDTYEINNLIILCSSTFLQLSYRVFCCILPWGIWFSLFHMAICLPSQMPEFTHSLFSCSIHYQSAWDPSCANKSDNVSCASLFSTIGYALHHVFKLA